MSYPAPVIFLPGIMGSTLRDEYPVNPENVWSVLKAAVKSYERITLHPDNLRFEVKEPSRVVRDQVFGLFYGEIIEELRYNLSPSPDEPVPVYPFAYDWRQPLARTQEELAAFIEEVVARTSLMRHYHADGYTAENGRVNLVAHSMGGLIVAGYVATHGLDRVDKVATLASPFRGSIEAIAKTTLGSSGFSSLSGGSREREAARVTPALYHLLPSYDGAVKPTRRDVFVSTNWQRSILGTLASFIERSSLRVTGEDDATRKASAQSLATALLTEMLDEAWTHRESMENLKLPDPKRWMVVAGVGAETRLDVTIRDESPGSPVFDVPDPKTTWKPKKPTSATGDNTVPFDGACCAFVPVEQMICVAPEDFGFWEMKDKLLSELGYHSSIPSMNLVIRLVTSHLRGKIVRDTCGRPAPGVSATAWDPPIDGLTAAK